MTLYEHPRVSYHRRPNSWFMCFCCLTTKEIPNLHLLSVSYGYPPMTGGISPLRAGDAESVSVSWRHYKNIEGHTAHTIVSWPKPKMASGLSFHCVCVCWGGGGIIRLYGIKEIQSSFLGIYMKPATYDDKTTSGTQPWEIYDNNGKGWYWWW